MGVPPDSLGAEAHNQRADARKGQQAIRELAGAMRDRTGNLPPMTGVFPAAARPGLPYPPSPAKGATGFR
jgi:hypothetical protein